MPCRYQKQPNFEITIEIKREEWEGLLSVKIENASSICNCSDDEQNQKHNKRENSKDQQPDRVNSLQTWSPRFILVQNS